MADDLEPAVRTLIDAANAGDIDAFLAGFTTDGVVDDWGREFRGAERIRSWSDAEFIGKRVTLEVTGVRTEDDTTTVSARVGGDGFNGPSDFAFTVAGDRIALMRIAG